MALYTHMKDRSRSLFYGVHSVVSNATPGKKVRLQRYNDEVRNSLCQSLGISSDYIELAHQRGDILL